MRTKTNLKAGDGTERKAGNYYTGSATVDPD